MKKIILASITLLFFGTITFGQSGTVKGQLIDFKTSKPITDKPIILFGTTQGIKSDSEGRFEFNKLKYSSTELIVHGGQLMGQPQEESIDYYTVCLRNIYLNKKNKTIDIGIIYMVAINDSVQFAKIPCKTLGENKFEYLLVDGADRYIDGKYVLIDFSNISKNCIE